MIRIHKIHKNRIISSFHQHQNLLNTYMYLSLLKPLVSFFENDLSLPMPDFSAFNSKPHSIFNSINDGKKMCSLGSNKYSMCYVFCSSCTRNFLTFVFLQFYAFGDLKLSKFFKTLNRWSCYPSFQEFPG